MKKILTVLLILALALCALACANPSAIPADNVSAEPADTGATAVPVDDAAAAVETDTVYDLRVGQMGTSIKASMVVLAHELGYYEEEGLHVSLEPINNLNDGLTAILGGSLDILPLGVIPTCTFVSQGADLTVIGGTIAEGSECIVMEENASDYVQGDLSWFSGKTIACVRPETGHMIMQARIREAGVDMSTVRFVELDGFQSVIEAVLKNEADVGFVNSGFGQNAKQQGLSVLFPVGEYAPDAVCCRQTALKANVQANREAYVRFEVANLRAMMLMLTDKAKTISVLTEYSGLETGYVDNCIYDGVMKISMDPCANRVEEFYNIMIANGDIDAETKYSMEDHVDISIYYDALNRVMQRYPDFTGFAEMLEAYAANDQ